MFPLLEVTLFQLQLMQAVEILLVFAGRPMLREGHSALKFGDFIIQRSRWALGPWINCTVINGEQLDSTAT